MNNKTNTFTSLAIASYFVKLLIDVVMLLFTIYNQNDLYYDDWYLYIPHIVSSVLMMIFYVHFTSNEFEGIRIKMTSIMLLLVHLAFLGLLTFDRTKGYILYFSLVAALNFFNALFIKFNIIPDRKPGTTGYAPMAFEITAFIVMAISMYSLFCAFPLARNKITMRWEYYDIYNGMFINIFAEFVLLVEYIVCRLHDSEYIEQQKVFYVLEDEE